MSTYSEISNILSENELKFIRHSDGDGGENRASIVSKLS